MDDLSIKILTPLVAALIAAAGAWLVERTRRQNALDLAVAGHRLSDAQKIVEANQRVEVARQEHLRALVKLENQHVLDLQKKEREILQQLAAGYAKDLRDKRADVYQKLWVLLEPFALFHPKDDVTYAIVAELGVELRKWYFSIGGLLLSTDARKAYFELQDAVVEVLRDAEKDGRGATITLRGKQQTWTLGEFTKLEDRKDWTPEERATRDYVQVRKRTSTLRSTLCDDLGSRAQPLISERPANPAAKDDSAAPRSEPLGAESGVRAAS